MKRPDLESVGGAVEPRLAQVLAMYPGLPLYPAMQLGQVPQVQGTAEGLAEQRAQDDADEDAQNAKDCL